MLYPIQKSEAEIQADIYFNLKANGLDCKLEVSDGKHRYDIVVFHYISKRPLCIIEVKKELKLTKHNLTQYHKYKKQTDLPVFLASEKGFDFLSIVNLVEEQGGRLPHHKKKLGKLTKRIRINEERMKVLENRIKENEDKGKLNNNKNAKVLLQEFNFKVKVKEMFDNI